MSDTLADFQKESDDLAHKLCALLDGQSMPVIGLAITIIARVFIVRAELDSQKGQLTMEVFLQSVRTLAEQSIAGLQNMSDQEREEMLATINQLH